ncbi:two component transcriptional regulator, winged helix family [Acidimicrobium ferrooxidans DSM 10331]|uniref:Two component transcriptional regulator, winged helix family n=1 Tax=Acidimicrobium ferrooxidans (strain DSM 10331 / JCM 15462 / NBRC 103882 / ICP) TaxID=525909 RepID=C7M271_ACIFD|nr:response regulator transcription factor [Acidimicrobium ferrooxidans]ACU53169.1 two component transcriptional regulator, winged helix family [Acidimicrobium ferrooxidans DSM 10331]
MAADDKRAHVGTVLIADDEPSFVEALVLGLTREGFETIVANDGEEALALSRSHHPDLILLDVMLPRLSGLDVCRTIRQESSVPIIMVTARSGELDTVLGLELGADDYVTKPFRMSELVARIRAQMRRTKHQGQAQAAEEILESHGITVYVDRHQVDVRGTEVRLPPKEFDLLLLFLRNPGRVLTRDLILDRVWGSDYYGDTKTLDVHVKRLRSKIEPDPNNPSIIATVRGVGYRLERDHARA